MPGKPELQKNKEQKQMVLKKIALDVEARKAPKDLPQFRALLKKKFGNFLRAWRIRLDIDGGGAITFHEFCVGVRGLGFDGSVKALWGELNVDGGNTISLFELDKETALRLERFKLWMCQRFPTSEDAWDAIAHPGQKQITEERFVKILPTLGWFEDRSLIHRMLDITDPPVGFITPEDIDFVGIVDTGAENSLPDLGMSFSEAL